MNPTVKGIVTVIALLVLIGMIIFGLFSLFTNRQLIDTAQRFDHAMIKLADGEIIEGRAAAERAKIAAQADADKAIIAANADLEVVKVQAEAALYAGEREAEMNQRISKSLTDELVSYYWIKQWNGELPTTVLSEDGNYMIALNTEEAK